MTRLQIFPYLRPAPSRVGVDWQLHLDDGPRPLPDAHPYWDPATPVDIVARVTLDLPAIRRDCALDAAARLRLAVTWQSPGTGLRGCGQIVDLVADGETPPLELHLHIDGALVADRLRCAVRLVLGATGSEPGPLAPSRPGSLLWSDERILLLEGGAARFPVELVDFQTNLSIMAADAAWYLDWDPDDLHLLALGSVRLIVNASHPIVRRAVTTAQPCDADRAIIDAIRYDVARTLIDGALGCEDFVAGPEQYEDGTVGAYARRLIRSHLGGDATDFGTLHDQWRQASTRPRLECLLQERVRLFREV